VSVATMFSASRRAVRAAPAVVLHSIGQARRWSHRQTSSAGPAAGGARARSATAAAMCRPAIDARSGLRPDETPQATRAMARRPACRQRAYRRPVADRPDAFISRPTLQRGAATVAAPVSGACRSVWQRRIGGRFAGSVLLPALPDRATTTSSDAGRIASRRRPIRCLSTALPDAYVTSIASRPWHAADGTRGVSCVRWCAWPRS